MIYDILKVGSNIILYLETATISDPYFLIVLTNPWDSQTKNLVTQGDGSENNWEITITGVAQAYEDLLSGEVYFPNEGTWAAAIYVQASSVNTDPNNATFLTNEKFQVI